MCQIVLRAVDNASGHPLAWKRGMPVEVLEDSHVFSARESLPPAQGGKFYIVKVPGVTVAEWEAQLNVGLAVGSVEAEYAPVQFDSALFDGQVFDADVKPLRRKAMDLTIDDLSPGQIQQLDTTGTITLTLSEAQALARRLSDGARI
jgi:hypothetical protein